MLRQKTFCHIWLQQVCAEYRKEPTATVEDTGSPSPVIVCIHDTSSCDNFQRKELAGGDSAQEYAAAIRLLGQRQTMPSRVA